MRKAADVMRLLRSILLLHMERSSFIGQQVQSPDCAPFISECPCLSKPHFMSSKVFGGFKGAHLFLFIVALHLSLKLPAVRRDGHSAAIDAAHILERALHPPCTCVVSSHDPLISQLMLLDVPCINSR